jgi:hypothetical protein
LVKGLCFLIKDLENLKILTCLNYSRRYQIYEITKHELIARRILFYSIMYFLVYQRNKYQEYYSVLIDPSLFF